MQHDFNGAPDRCPGRGLVDLPEGQLAAELQWSPGQMPGESDRRAPGPRRNRHFNGAPDRCPGRAAFSSGEARVLITLQWSPGQMPGESRDRRHRARDRIRTSMEPRTDARGEPAIWSPDVSCEALQWSPGQMPGESLDRTDDGALAPTLQWSPGQMPGERLRGLQGHPARSPTSMEPRTDARGEVGRARGPLGEAS